MLTKNFCRNIANYPTGDISAAAIHEAKRSFLNWLGVAVGACKHPSVDMALKVADNLGGNQQASILGRRLKTNMYFAALINGMSSHIFDFDDTLLDTVLHPSAPTIPALLAWGEHNGISGRSFLQGIVIGIEAEQRVAQAICPSHYDHGWHVTGTAGAFGAAAAVGRMMNLDEERMCFALGLAATQPTGLREMFGTMTKPYHPGKAAANGLLAALLANEGFTSSLQSLEAKRGYLNVLSPAPNPAPIEAAWGQSWKITSNTYKPFACGIVTHPSIEAAIRLKKRGITPQQIKSIVLEVHPLVVELTGKKEPADSLAAKFSVYHCAAVGMFDGACGERQFALDRVCDDAVIALRRKITTTVNDNIASDQAVLKAQLVDGTVVEEFVEHAVGSITNPIPDQGIEEKFRALTSGLLAESEQTRLISLAWHLEDVATVRDITANI